MACACSTFSVGSKKRVSIDVNLPSTKETVSRLKYRVFMIMTGSLCFVILKYKEKKTKVINGEVSGVVLQ